MKTKEQTFNEVLSTQTQYHWLGHQYEKTPEQIRELKRTIKDRVKRLQSKVISFVLIIGLTGSLMSCNKQYQDDPTPPQTPTEQNKEVSVRLGLTTDIKDSPMSKSYDPSVWVYQYSTTQFELKFTNQYNTYTKQVSINELKQGNVIMTMFAGKYDVSYNPVHNPLYSDKIDVSINMIGVQVNGTPINLTGNIEDALFIVDIPKTLLFSYPTAVIDSRGGSYETLNYDPVNDFYYGYTNIKPVHPLTIYFLDMSYGSVDVPIFQKGHVYWMSKTQNGTINLTFPSLTVERITL